MKKQILIMITSIIFILIVCDNTENAQKESAEPPSQQTSITITQQPDYASICKILNKAILDIDYIDWVGDFTEDKIYQYSEEVKGKFKVTLNEESIFPPVLVKMLEEALYNSCNYSPRKQFMDEIMDNCYFDTIRDLGYENFELSLDEIYHLFPELYKHKDEFKSEYDAYKFISGTKMCIDMFYINMTPSEENYIFVYTLGGSNGAVRIELTKLINNEFITISEFEAQNSGYGKVIMYEESFYYIFLHYNYNLKYYDGIRLHKLGFNADVDNILIKYLPENYIWRNIYNTQTRFSSKLADYIDCIKDDLTSDDYIENGFAAEIGLISGDETEDADFILSEKYNNYYNVDFANLGIPVYIRKSNHIPSDYRSTWHLRAKFFIYNPIDNSIIELDNLELGKHLPRGIELVQMWFKEIDNMIFTFRVYHISDYNYVLNVVLIEGDTVTQIRNDIFSPQRKFILTEGIRYINF